MAKIYSKENALKDQYESEKKKMIIGFGACAFFFLLWMANIIIFHTFNPLFVFPVFLGFLVSGLYAKYMHQKVQKLESGVEGESSTINFLQTLPDTYSVVSNAKITYEGRVSELDNIIIGTNGVFVVETKNHNGCISGSYTDDKLSQTKIGQGGNMYTSQFYNPIRQVSTHVYRLSNILKENGFKIWVQGIVYFSNSSAEIEVEYDYNETPVFAKSNDGERELCNYINDYTSSNSLSQSDINRIVNILIR